MIIVLFHVLYLLSQLVFRRRYDYGAASRVVEDDDESGGIPVVAAAADAVTMSGKVVEGDAGVVIKAEEGSSDSTMEPSKAKMTCWFGSRRVNDDDDEEFTPTIRFTPPAYVQRYQAVADVLADKRYGGKLKKVVDFGCSELGFCMYLKNMTGVQEAIFVDVDRLTLDMYKKKTRPLHVDHLHRRSSPLVMRVMEGSVTQYDKCLENCDAVVCIELIEHLYPETLTDLPYNIFGLVKPKVAIITTPNADFNVLFTNLIGFRHPDHKFEWTRKEFQDWANNIVSRFPKYEVTFHGICNGPPGTEDLGSCSQMAVFHKVYDLKDEIVPGIEGLYTTIVEHEFPYEIDNRSDEQKILDDAVYYIHRFSGNDEDLTEEVALEKLLTFMSKYYISIEELKEILQNANWNVVEREDGPVVIVPPPSDFFDHSMVEDDFLDNDIPPGNYDWGDPGPPIDYYNRDSFYDINIVEEEDWENEPHIIVSHTQPQNENVDNNIDGINLNTNEEDSTTSIHPEDVCLDDIETESRSAELANSEIDESILISSFSETKGSENSETTKCSYVQAQELEPESSLNDSRNVTVTKDTSLCSIFLEPSNISQDLHLEDVTDPVLETTIATPSVTNTNKKLRLNSRALLNASFDEPQYTSSPRVSSSLTSKKRKDVKSRAEYSDSDSSSCCNEDLMVLCTNASKDTFKKDSSKFDTVSSCSNESVIAESNHSNGCSPQINHSECSEKLRHYTGTIPKNFSEKLSETKSNIQKETKIERISPDIPESPPNSWSPEIMDSGYPNSNSLPDLSPEYDLSSIAHDRSSDSESPSIADAPRIGFYDAAEIENRDLANNNLDGEGNNMEGEENHHINDLRPLFNVLENDLENENDIYFVRNGFPIWLLRILQRFDADGVGINLPMLRPPNENFGE